MDFPQLMPSGAAMTQQGWVQPFKAGGGPILPGTATWASRPPLPERLREPGRNSSKNNRVQHQYRRVNRKDVLYEGSYDDWREKLLSDVAAATKEVETDANIEVMDSRLAHLMEAKRSIKQRWENKLNRALRKRIARLNTQIAQYAGELERKQWIEVCDKVDGQMRVGGKGNLLKHFLKAGNTRSAQRSAMEHLVHREFEWRHKDELMDELAERYFPIHAGRVEAEDSVYEGTPQGAVISPLLFNIGMSTLARKLDSVKKLGSAIYADDITLWPLGGSTGETELVLQKVVEIVQYHTGQMNLELSCSKSELLVYQPIRMGRRPKGWTPVEEVDIHLRTRDGEEIPRARTIRILGMLISANGRNRAAILKLQQHTAATIRLIQRVSGKKVGIKEDNLLRLFHAFLLGHINYVASMHNWSAAEKNKLEVLVRKTVSSRC
ncbi:hypothetical protein HPB50_016092 [Hyalomma asiaticum]|uniref:Uncharacterized protein n=1 Tax=Hyalomma asiaticum TaxID=266040 RepID=A0ACB7SZ14_HYAAI|nr:hypothetical protein HPB50_016092 [Hyalomma asiaticum]